MESNINLDAASEEIRAIPSPIQELEEMDMVLVSGGAGGSQNWPTDTLMITPSGKTVY